MDTALEKFLLIIGAPKCGTTSLFNALARHPAIAPCTAKEPCFFTDFSEIAWRGPGSDRFPKRFIGDEATYLQSFETGGATEWGLEGSTDYLWNPKALERIAAWRARFAVKIVVVLRDPVSRLLSEYQHTVRDHIEKAELADALELEDERYAKRHHPLFYHVRRSVYHDRVKRFHALFGDDMLILDYHDPIGLSGRMAQVLDFMGVDRVEAAPARRFSATHTYRSPVIDRIMKTPSVKRLGRRLMPKALRNRLSEKIHDANRVQYRMTNRDRAAIRSRLGEEIRYCLDNPLIPTAHWREARETIA